MARPLLPNAPVTPTSFRLSRNEMMVSEDKQKEDIVGVDLFIESSGQPEFIAKKCQRHAGVKFQSDQYQQPGNPGMARPAPSIPTW